MKKLFIKFKRTLLQLRILMTVLTMLLVFIACFALSLLAGASLQRVQRAQAEQNMEALLSQVINNVSYYLDDMEALSAVLSGHHSVLRLLLNNASIAENRSEYYENATAVRSFLSDLSRLRSEIMSITIIGENGSFVGTQEIDFVTDQLNSSDYSWYPLAIANRGKAVYLSPHIISNYAGRQQSVISLIKSLSIGNTPPSGAMAINLSLDTLGKICSDVRLADGGYVFIVDGQGNYVYHPNGRHMQPYLAADADGTVDAITSRVLDGEKGFLEGGSFVVGEAIESAGYQVVGVVPYESIVGHASALRRTQTWIGACFSIVIAVIVAWLLNCNVFVPLNDLKGLMNRARSGDLGVTAAEAPHNEIGELGAGFNAMLRRIHRLIDDNATKEKEKRKAEFDALQAQINPHFLYNTLDSIVWMTHCRPDIAASMADSLAKLFRLMLSRGSDFVPLLQEIEHVSEYLSIQHLRYSSKFTYRVDAEPGTESLLVPKLILQPLVENAIYHGIKPSRKICHLLVKAFIDGDRVLLIVGDDGVGMTEQKASAVLLGADSSEKNMGGIGVRNINERIALNYGDGYGVSYFSKAGVGTLAILELPIESGSAAAVKTVRRVTGAQPAKNH